MAPRAEFQALLEDISDHVYFQAPDNGKLEYPCIIYSRDSAYAAHADNALYLHKWRYTVTVIDRSPDSPIIAEVLKLPLTEFSRHFKADGLNHDVFNIFF